MEQLGAAIRNGGRWVRRRDRLVLDAGGTAAELRDDGRVEAGGRSLVLRRGERGVSLVTHDGSTVLRVTHVTKVRQTVATATARYRVVRKLGPLPVWQLTSDVGGAVLLEILAIGSTTRLRAGSGADGVKDAELGRLVLAASLAVWQGRRALPAGLAAA